MSRLLPLLLLLGCAEPEPEISIFEGPMFDANTGLKTDISGPVIVALTELHVRNQPGPGKQFGDHANRIGEYLYGSEPPVPGFIGGSFRNIGKLQQWTMSVWTDEASMVAFILSEPHLGAMAVVDEVSTFAKSTHIEVDPSELPFTWDRALDELEPLDWTYGSKL
jgi:hypothetical protein